ncbi:hypothetical protein [Candidatus Williamhamiltonella defendens]|uniref:hypothetical protein n=1 Tax=Candidatus Williamhamiltonella defendens TaxID=138072 RepID=UPI001C9D8204
MYPNIAFYPEGKLKLFYKYNPMAFLAEHVVGKASNGSDRILEITIKTLHQMSPFFVGIE